MTIEFGKLAKFLDIAKISYQRSGNYVFIDVNDKTFFCLNLKLNQIVIGEYLVKFHSHKRPFRKRDISSLFDGQLRFYTEKQRLVQLWHDRIYHFRTIQDALKIILKIFRV